MTSRDFCYWLQGLFELVDPQALNAEQTACVKRHLAMVFIHEIDPSAGGLEKQAALNEAHEQSKPHPFGYSQGDLPPGVKIRC